MFSLSYLKLLVINTFTNLVECLVANRLKTEYEVYKADTDRIIHNLKEENKALQLKNMELTTNLNTVTKELFEIMSTSTMIDAITEEPKEEEVNETSSSNS